MSGIGIKGVDPCFEVCVLCSVYKGEDGTLAIGVTSQKRYMRGILASCKSTMIVLVSCDIVNSRREPSVVRRIELLSLEVVEVNRPQTLQLTSTRRTADLGG